MMFPYLDLILLFCLIGLVLLLIYLFLTHDAFRKYRIYLKIRWRMLYSFARHLYYDLVYLVKLAELVRVIAALAILAAFIFILALGFIAFWNIYMVKYLGMHPISLPQPQQLLSSRFNIFWIVGAAGGSLLSMFIKPKLDKFADKVNAKPRVIYVFGSNVLTQKLIRDLINLGIGPMIALIAERKYYWIEDLGKTIDVLILDSPDELKMPTIYDKITFRNALKIISLVDDPELNQHIILNVRRNNPDAEIIILSRNRPYILDLVGEHVRNITVIEDLETITREIIRKLALGFIYPPVIEAPIPEDYIGKRPDDIERDFNQKIIVLGVKRNDKILHTPEKFEKNDMLILYLTDTRVLREFLQLLPLEKEVTEIKQEKVKVEEEEKRNVLKILMKPKSTNETDNENKTLS